MFSFIRNKNTINKLPTPSLQSITSNTTNKLFYSITEKTFAFGKWNLYKFRRDTSSYALKDFTKSPTAKQWLNKEVDKQKAKIKTEKLSSLLQTEDKRKLSKLNPYIQPSKRQFNRFVRKKAINKMAMNESKDFDDLAMRLFVQDHTAQVLENIRKTKENKIFNRKMHEIKEKKLALKLEARKPENIIENFEQKFLNYQNFNDNEFDPNKSYSLFNFLPEGRRTLGRNLSEQNELNNKINNTPTDYVVNNKFMEYEKNKKQLTNMRINSMLNGKKNNEALQKYLENGGIEFLKIEEGDKIPKSQNFIENQPQNIKNYHDIEVTNNYSEISVSENKIPAQSKYSASSSLSSTLNKSSSEIYTENSNLTKSLQSFFNPQIELTSKINQYELEVYNEFKKLDLYSKYNKGQVKFGDLTLDENLNYIKFNITNSSDLFKMYREVIHKDFVKYNKENIQDRPVIYSAILQKFALGVKNEEKALSLFTEFDYKNLLRDIKDNIPKISDKNLVDNLWSIGKLHRSNRNFSPVFFTHLLNEMITELATQRVEYLSFEAISYMVEGLDFLKISPRYDDEMVVSKEIQLGEKIYDRILEICKNDALLVQFHPFNLAKILNYFYNENLEIEKFSVLLDSLGRPLKEFILKNESSLADIIDTKDLVKIVKAYSWGIVKQGISGRGRRNEIYFRSESVGDEVGKNSIQIFNSEDTSQNLPIEYGFKENSSGIEFYKEVLNNLSTPIFIKNKTFEITHCANFIYHYTNANVYDTHLFRQLNTQIVDKLEKVEDFKIEDVLYFTYGMSKFYTKNTFPNFFHDVMNVIYPNLNEKATSYKYQILNKFKNRLFEKNDTLHLQNLSLILYTASLMGYSDIDFYLPIYHNVIMVDKELVANRNNKNKIPMMKFEDLGYFLQSLALLNFNDEYIIKYFLEKIVYFINKCVHIDSESEEGFKLNFPLNHFSLSQNLSAIVNLSSRKYYRDVHKWKETIEKLKHYVNANFGSEDVHNSVSVLWFLTYAEIFDQKIFDKLMKIINDNKTKLRKFDSIVLNQIIVGNYIKNEYIFSELKKEFVEDLNKYSKDFEGERSRIQKKISLDDKYQDMSFVEKFKDVLRKNQKELAKEGYNYQEDFLIANSFIAPVYFPNNKLCVLFYDHTERMKDKNINGYNSIKESILYSLGYKIERVYAQECDGLLDSDEKMYDFIIKKIK
jgi:hypothetical protein